MYDTSKKVFTSTKFCHFSYLRVAYFKVAIIAFPVKLFSIAQANFSSQAVKILMGESISTWS